MLKTMAGTVGLTLLFGLMGGWWLGRRVYQTHQAINSSAARLLAGNLTERLPTTGHNDEFDALVTRFNELISTIENLTLTLRSVLDSTAHDLRGHLHRIQQSIEHLRSNISDSNLLPMTDHVLLEVDRLNNTVEGLLRIALAESDGVQLEPVDLSILVSNLCEFYEPIAINRLKNFISPNMFINGHRTLLNQALSNLIDNALKYSDMEIDVSLSAERKHLVLTVRDYGPGIPEAWAPLATQRFKRLPSSSGLPGSGLGLSLAAAVARLHRAELQLINAEPGLMVKIIFTKL
jgi:signal transduction histidine kinase